MPQHGIGRVHGDVERREPEVDDALDLAVRQIGQRDVVPVEEGQPVVVVLDVEALPQTGRQLMDEAEHALVGARRDLGRRGRLALEAEVPPPLALEDDRARTAAPIDVDREMLLAGLHVEVDEVAQLLPVHPEEPVARTQPGPRGQTLRIDRQHPDAGRGHPLRHQRTPQST